MKKRLDLAAGVKYRGYGMVNEYGEFEFTPEETGKRKGVIKTIKETEQYTLSTSKKKVLIHIRIERSSGLKLIQALFGVVNNIVTDLRNYEI